MPKKSTFTVNAEAYNGLRAGYALMAGDEAREAEAAEWAEALITDLASETDVPSLAASRCG